MVTAFPHGLRRSEKVVIKKNFTASCLVPGQDYRVIKEFIDFDNRLHPVGETWQFSSKAFLPYDDGLSLFVSNGGREEHIRLQWRPDAQLDIIENFYEHVTAIGSSERIKIDRE